MNQIREIIGRSDITSSSLCLVAILLVGLFIRAIGISEWPLWGDEALTLMIAQWPLQTLFFQPVDPTAGLYYALHKMLLGPLVDAGTARLISLAAGTLLIPASYFLAREARVPALLCAALIALSFPLIDYSQEARAYSLLVLQITCSAALFIRWSRTRQLRHLLLSLLLSLLAFYTHFISVFWIGPMVLAALSIGRKRALLPLSLFAILALPELARLFYYDGQNGFSWLRQATLSEAFDTLLALLLPFQATGWLATFIVGIFGWRIWHYRTRFKAWADDNRIAALVIFTLLAWPLLVWLFGFWTPIYMSRTILPGILGFSLILAALLGFERRFVRFVVLGFWGASLLVHGTTRHKEEWGAIADRVGGDAILICQSWKAAALRHALDGNQRLFIGYYTGFAEIPGSPWPVAYFQTMSNSDRMAEAMKRAARIDRNLYPVWPVKSGVLAELQTAPTTLGDALEICEGYRAGFGRTYTWPNR